TAAIPDEEYEAVVRANILGTHYGSVVALRHFLTRRSGKLINLLGRGDNGRPAPLQNGYAPSKAWVRSYTRALAAEYRDSGVGIYALNPGLMLTDLVTRPRALAGYEEKLQPLSMVLKALGNPPEYAAHKALWLASPATDGRTGLEVRVLSAAKVLAGVARMALGRLAGRPAGVPLRVQTVKPVQKQ
ncbi:MAG TPA: SDR family oxidoreductase, partial [Symbiobacteriaceae bacterium]|nr:SDR family oxidoreductase [Symbiobacteriaceae bacterium]